MPTTKLWARACISGVLVAACLCAAETDPAAVFESLYGNRIKKVAATADTADDLELADALIKGAEESLSQVELAKLMCERAQELALKAGGFDLAAKAMEQLVDLAGDDRVQVIDLLTRLAAARQRQVAVGGASGKAAAAEQLAGVYLRLGAMREAQKDLDGAGTEYRRAVSVGQTFKLASLAEAREKVAAVTERAASMKQFDDVRGQLERSPDSQDLMARMATIALVNLEDPALLAPYLPKMTDAALRAVVTAAQPGAPSPAPEEAMLIGDWYRAAAEKAPATTAARLRQRAAAAYGIVIDANTDPTAVLKAKLAVQAMGVAPAVTAPQPVAPRSMPDKPVPATLAGGWVDLLKTLDPAEVAKGQWRVQGQGVLTGPLPDAKARRLTFAPGSAKGYEIVARVRVTPGEKGFTVGVSLPIAGRNPHWDLSPDRSWVGRFGKNNASFAKGDGNTLRGDQTHEIAMIVSIAGDKLTVRTTIDGKVTCEMTKEITTFYETKETGPHIEIRQAGASMTILWAKMRDRK